MDINRLNTHVILTDWNFEPYTLALFLLFSLTYFYMWLRSHSPASYLVFTSIGFLIVFCALFSFLDEYNGALFTVHIIQHMLMAMVAPPFIALGRPIKVFLKGSNRKFRKVLSKIAHALRFLLNPIFSGMFMVGSMYALYFSALYGHTLHNEFLHALVHFHMLVTGVLFSISILGVDSIKVAPVYMRLLALFLTLPLHAFLGVAIMGSDRMIIAHSHADRIWGPTPILDQYIGGAILWSSGDITSIIYIIVVFIEWSRASERKGRALNRINR